MIIENNSIEIPTEVHIKEIRIKRRFLKQSRHALIQRAKDSTMYYGGNCLHIKYINENEATQLTKDFKFPDYLIADIYNFGTEDQQYVNDQIKIHEYNFDSIRADRKYNLKYLQSSGDRLYFDDYSFTRRIDSLLAQNIRIGLGYGPEVLLSGFMPKISYINFSDKGKVKPYYGAEISIWITNAFWMSNNYLYGIKKDFVTFECSAGYWWFPNKPEEANEFTHYFHSTITPKLGVKFWKIWFKVGPSFPIYKNYSKELYGSGNKIGNTSLNIEMLFFIN